MAENIAVGNESIVEEEKAKTPEKCTKSTPDLKKKMSSKTSIADDSIKKLLNFDIECRESLHALQLEVERSKIRNLNKEYSLLSFQEEYKKLQINAEKKRLRNLDMEYEIMKGKIVSDDYKSCGRYLLKNVYHRI